MAISLSPNLVSRGKQIYTQLQYTIETKYPGQYIAIDPISSEYFISTRLADALRMAKDKFPDRTFYTVRIGYETALTFSA